MIRTKILPYFESRKMEEIELKDIIAWQNELLSYKDESGQPYSATYLKTIHSQLSAIFNHAVRFYHYLPIQHRKPEQWVQRNIRKCYSGQKKNI